MKRSVALSLLWCLILLGGTVAGAAPVSGATQQPTSTTAQADQCASAYDRLNGRTDRSGPTVSITATAPAPGVVSLNYSVPDRQSSFTVSVPDHQDIKHVEGFEQPHTGYFKYTGDGSARIEYAVNRSFHIPDSGDPEVLPESFTAHNESVATSVIPRHDSAPFELEFPGGGYAGTTIMYVGGIDHVETISNGPNDHRVVVPSAVDPAVGNASIEGLRLGAAAIEPRHYYCESTLFLHPADVRGYAARADSVAGENWGENVPQAHTPLHEYVHLNQRYHVSDEMRWFTEGSATYLTARILYDNEELTPAEYDAHLTYWTRYYSGSNLTNSSSYLSDSRAALDRDDYLSGALVLARLDADLRANGNATIYDLFTAVGSGEPSTDYNVSAFHADYARLGGNRSEAELRTLLEQPETIEPTYVTPSARVLPDSITRHPSYTGLTPRETEIRVLPFVALLLLIVVEGVLRVRDSITGRDVD
ncbi:hypothetical protein [Halorubrum sp. CGM4_25_10-8A]|uniref:hypothetical protein n=1 Tax=Halorubrum sp. CGM4_25_10-8A TaxID=2518116 RepID=UPI0010F9BA1A|nr:hypothetical protein [Halorubrum sp. CGM4_25_10-8A]TKX36628.1 hypothetical protein EXE52_16255 [Halorubrum sp. CGM4_25_10-8A]